MARKAQLVTAAALVVLGALVTGGALKASAGASSGNQLAGTWEVAVNRPPPLTPLRSVQVFSGSGSVIEMANEWSATRTASHGSWERIDGRRYAASSVFFRFNPQTGADLGSQKIDRTILLAQDGQTFTHVARVTILDRDGNVSASFIARGSGARMQVERIPDQP